MHPVPEETIKAISTNAAWDTHARVTDAFLSLARHQHSTGEMDPDVQIGLGILFYSNGEYDRTQDCFESALTARPKVSLSSRCLAIRLVPILTQDYLLWNRLGSSLSNGSKPEEALGAYREALQLRPTYTRAIYNVGVACTLLSLSLPCTITNETAIDASSGLNLGAHKEAAEHFLSALEMQGAGTSRGSSEQLWQTLRRAFLAMVGPIPRNI
jgi:peroxin-5